MPKSYHILLTAFGSHGDIHPYMAIACELIRRGHRASIGTSRMYEDKIVSAGIDFAHVRPDISDDEQARAMMRRAMHPRTGTKTVVRDMVLAHLGAAYEDTVQAAAGCDAIVSHVLSYASPIVAEQRGMPWIFTGLQPIVFFSAVDASVPPNLPWAIRLRAFGAGFYRHMMRLGMAGVESWAEPIYALRRSAGLPSPSANPITMGQFSPYLNLALFSEVFAAPAPDWPAQTRQTGFCFYDRYDSDQRPAPAALDAFLDSGPPPIVFTLGTAAVRNPGAFFHESVAAAKRLGARALLLTGSSTGNENDLALTRDIAAFGYAPYGQVFPKAAAIVHQGGIGTTAQALRSGRPMAIVPFAHDQFDNARRCAKLGVSRTIARAAYREKQVARVLCELLAENGSFVSAASAAGDRIKSEAGVENAVELILQTLRS